MINAATIKKFSFLIISIIGELASFVFLVYVKYRIHNLPLESIDFSYTGNVLNLITSLSISLILVYNFFRIKKLKLLDIQIFLNLLFLSILLLVVISLLLSKDFYVLSMLEIDEYKFEKIVGVLLWLMFYLVKTGSLFFLLLRTFNVKKILLPKILLFSVFSFGVVIIFSFIKIFLISKTGDEYYFLRDEKFDAVIILGAAVWRGDIPSPIYEARLKKGFELINKKYSDVIVLTGSNAPNESSEARVGKVYLEKIGLPPDKIVIEEKTTSTIEQIHFIKNEMMQKRKLRKVVIVSDAFHLPRVIEISKFLSVDLKVVRSSFNITIINNIWFRLKESVLLTIFWLFGV